MKNENNAEHPYVFEVIAEGDEANCRALYLAVIVQHIADAKGRMGNVVEQAQARIWLEGREGIRSGLYEVCAYAGLDFEKTRRRIAEILLDDTAVVDFRKKLRDKEHNQTVANRKRYFRRAAKSEKDRSREKSKLGDFITPEAANDNTPRAANDNQPTEKE